MRFKRAGLIAGTLFLVGCGNSAPHYPATLPTEVRQYLPPMPLCPNNPNVRIFNPQTREWSCG